ncbi:glycosyltransferase family 2 protein [sulfur-oxidizing endosymbiont of Gigantopelta aegis]|uniref:glycosyltransferase family 2 protein n=1 Tax=sulfur-oxidizing endosymbiont of Gigantopelta aegis TaxID=2794934 RepID=UPI0018DDA1E9|nr:glycosyltransferase family 2 protein [sulfur-oxidizing endosymbiont of Gigantopelta aegis]
MRISLITVCYNSQNTIEATFESVAVQDYNNLEYIVVDGKSTDETMSIVKRYATTISHSLSEPDSGIYDAMNKGIRLATGDVIGFINADDVLVSPDVISQVAKNLLSKDVDACYADLEYVDPVNLNKIIRFWRSSEFVPGLFSQGWAPPHPTFYVKKSIYEQYGLFSLSYKMGNDIEIMLRFLEKYKIRSHYIPRTWVKMRMGGVSNHSLSNIYTQNKEIIKAARDNGISFSLLLFVVGKVKNRLKQYLFK